MNKPKSPNKKLPAPRKPVSAQKTKPEVLERLEPPPARRGLDRNRIIIWFAVIVIVAQLFAPLEWKPFYLAGEAAAMFHGALFDEVNRKELELTQQAAIAQKIADLQSEYATWKGLCSLTSAFDPATGAACMRAADAHFENALRQIRNSELIYR
ncbi:MAG: hypothetical protein AAGG57_12100 [Pseudomonadota bacterium]